MNTHKHTAACNFVTVHDLSARISIKFCTATATKDEEEDEEEIEDDVK